ncbi:MAG: hypothetical protein JW863_03015 [Chitinispirillaceae bacterium]|nr:hypothetical protein [Chitinispirillaceae bacterium]
MANLLHVGNRVKNLFIFLIVILAAYYAWDYFTREKPLEPLYEVPYVVVYGTEKCDATYRCLKSLEEEGIEPIFRDINDEENSTEMYSRMKKAGLGSSWGVTTPVVDVNGKIFTTPYIDSIIAVYDREY